MNPLETRTSASECRSCTRCGRPIGGRRKNGFCSDNCRLKKSREEAAVRRGELLNRLLALACELESELIPTAQPNGHDR